MPNLRDQAICIRHWDFSETSQTVSLLTRSHGVIRGLAKGAKREKGDFSGGIELLTQGEIVAITKPSRDLATLTSWHLDTVWWTLRRSLAANRAGLYTADLVHRMLTAHDPHPEVYAALIDALDTLERGVGPSVVLARFQWDLLEETGYRPELDRDAETGAPLDDDAATLAFSPRAGGLVADTGAQDRWRVRVETVRALRGIAAGNDPSDDEPTARAVRLLATWIREILGEHPPSMRWALPDLP